MKTNYSILIALFVAGNLSAQSPMQRILGGADADRAQSLIETSDQKMIVNGATLSFGSGSADAILCKMDLLGNLIWSYTYGTTEYDNSEDAIEVTDLGIVCTGRSNLQTGFPTSALLFKTDSSGQLLWSKAAGGVANDGLVHVIETPNQDLVAVGYSGSLSSGGRDVLLIRTNSMGDTIFTRSYGSLEDEEGRGILLLADGGFLITGRQRTFPGGIPRADGLIIRTDPSGNMLWANLYGDSLWEELTGAVATADGGFLVTGSDVTFGFGGYDVVLMKIDSLGSVQWARTYGGSKTDASYDIYLNSDSTVVMAGYTESLGYGNEGSDESNIFLMKTDIGGELIWMNAFGDGLQDEAFRAAVASDGYLIPGFTRNYFPNDSSQMFIIRTDLLGQTGCHEQYTEPADTFFTMPFTPAGLTQSAGINYSNTVLVRNSAPLSNYDACLLLKAPSGETAEDIRVFPNPFSDHFTLMVPDASPESHYLVHDLTGRIIKKGYVQSSQSIISLNECTPGVYFLTLLNEEGTTTLRLLKQ